MEGEGGAIAGVKCPTGHRLHMSELSPLYQDAVENGHSEPISVSVPQVLPLPCLWFGTPILRDPALQTLSCFLEFIALSSLLPLKNPLNYKVPCCSRYLEWADNGRHLSNDAKQEAPKQKASLYLDPPTSLPDLTPRFPTHSSPFLLF